MMDSMTEDAIEIFVHAFYEKLRRDPVLGPIFTAVLGRRWDAHVRRMCGFWGSAMRISARYKGDMLAAHRRLGPLSPVLFERWLALFEETAKDHFAQEPAAALCDRARKTARNLKSALSEADAARRMPVSPVPGGT